MYFPCKMAAVFTRFLGVLAVTAALLASPNPLHAAAGAPRSSYNFNGGWLLHVGEAAGADAPAFDDAAWKKVTLPYGYNEDDAFRLDIAALPNGISWYRKHFTLPADATGKKVFLEFEGVRFAGEVWVNGQRLVLSEDGVMAFGADATAVVKPGENVVAVRCDSSWGYRERATNSTYQWNDRNFYANYGGINKNVILHVADKLHQTLPLYSSLGTTGVYVYAKDIDVSKRTATIHAESQVRNERDAAQQVGYDVTIADLEGRTVARFSSQPTQVAPGETKVLSAEGPLANVNLWSWGYGYLYTVTTSLTVNGEPVDQVATKTGFRHTEFKDGALKLNGRTLQLKGYAQRTTNEWPALGINLPPWVSDFSNGLMVESNGNLVRWMHVTPSKQDVESCDRVGLIQAMPAGDSERDPDGRRWELRVKLMRDAVVYNRNNPSIIFYEGGNKGVSEAHMRELLAVRDELDPHGGRAMGSREMLGSKTAEWGGEMLYINKSATKPLWATEYMRDEQLRKHVDEFTPPFHKDGEGPLHNGQEARIYNRNGDSNAVAAVKNWFDYYRERPGTGRRVSGGGVNIIFSDSNTHHRGAENYRRSGEVDAMRLPKDSFFAHQVMWDGWADAEKPRAHIVGHWNYGTDVKKDVLVISSADNVELFLNDKPLGTGERSSHFLFTFRDVAFAPGTLRAVGSDAKGKQVCVAELKTAGEPASIKLTPRTSPTGLHADGSDLALVDVEVVDANGQRVPTAMHPIEFTLEGPAEWRGGIAQVPENGILAKTLPVELGVNRVTVRSTTSPGQITLRATTSGLRPASISLESKEAPVKDGLSTRMPHEGLKPTLSRGPTPAGDSVRPTRLPVQIVRAIAGSNAPTTAPTTAQIAAARDTATRPVTGTSVAENSIDDNEETAWSSAEGKLSDAWVRYEFERPTQVNELVMRLGSWRQRSYPIRVLVDDQEVYVGATPRSLGYVTVPLKPTTGRSLTIRLIGEPSNRDDFNIVEITGKKLTDEESNVRGSLRIHEAEVYGPLPESAASR
jgi:beta-galactosidase